MLIYYRQNKRKAAGKSTEKPNIIMGANAQVALEKVCRISRDIFVKNQSNST